MVVVLVVLSTNNECQKHVVRKVSFGFVRVGVFSSLVEMANSLLQSEQTKSNFKIPVFSLLTFENCSAPELLSLLHLLSDTDFCNFFEVHITSGD